MQDAVIVSTARTPIAKAWRGAFNDLTTPSMSAIAIRAAVERAGIEPGEIEDLVLGTAMQSGTAAINPARLSALAAGLPLSVAGQTIDRQCASGLMAIAIGAQQIRGEGMHVVVGAGQEQISLVQQAHMQAANAAQDATVRRLCEHAYMPMLHTAEHVAKRYGIDRQAQDRYAWLSQQRTAAAQAAGLFADEIVPVVAQCKVVDKVTGIQTHQRVHLIQDQGNRPQTRLADLEALQPVVEGGCVTAGNASQLSDGASACVLMSGARAARLSGQPLGLYRGMAVVGLAPEEMGIGPVLAIPRLLARHALRIEDVGLWEINEAFACQVLYCAEHLGIDPARLNVNGGAIAIGHPYGMSGARMVGHALLEGRRRKVRYVVVSMCVGGGMGAAGLFEVL